MSPQKNKSRNDPDQQRPERHDNTITKIDHGRRQNDRDSTRGDLSVRKVPGASNIL